MRISDWSSDVCSSDLGIGIRSALEGRGPGDEHVGARGDRQWCGAAVDAAVDFQPDVAARLVDHLAHRLDLAKLAGDEALAAETGIDAHDEDKIELFDQIVEQDRKSTRLNSSH